MTATKALHTLIAPAYLDRAIKSAKAHRWAEAEADIDRYSALLPHDHRAPLLLAKIRLREGRVAECLAALGDARRLGHERSDNDRMIGWLHAQDRRQPDRLVIRERWRSQLRAVRERAHAFCSDLWAQWPANLIAACLVIATLVLYLYYLDQPS